MQSNLENFKSEYNIETIYRSIRLYQNLNDLPLSISFELFTRIFGNDLIELVKNKISIEYIKL